MVKQKRGNVFLEMGERLGDVRGGSGQVQPHELDLRSARLDETAQDCASLGALAFGRIGSSAPDTGAAHTAAASSETLEKPFLTQEFVGGHDGRARDGQSRRQGSLGRQPCADREATRLDPSADGGRQPAIGRPRTGLPFAKAAPEGASLMKVHSSPILSNWLLNWNRDPVQD